MEVSAGMKELLNYIARNLLDNTVTVTITEYPG